MPRHTEAPSARKRPVMSRLDAATRLFWRAQGRPVDLNGAERWLDGPMHDGSTVGDAWLQETARGLGGQVREAVPGAGLLTDMSQLDGPHFTAADLQPAIRDFYEHTADWRMEVWTQWSPVFQPGGELVSRLFGRRVQQLALPTQSLKVARGIDSRVSIITDADGRQLAAGWLRTLRSTGDYLYSGSYSTQSVPLSPQPSVRVAFPLERGNVQVFLRPAVLPGGELELLSPAGRFGEDGAYVVVLDDRGRAHAARAPIRERFHLYLDEGTLRADHLLCLWSAPALRLHYKLTQGHGSP